MGFNPSFNTMAGPMMDMATFGGIDSMLYSREGFTTTNKEDENNKKKKSSSIAFYIILFIILIILAVGASVYFNINLSSFFN